MGALVNIIVIVLIAGIVTSGFSLFRQKKAVLALLSFGEGAFVIYIAMPRAFAFVLIGFVLIGAAVIVWLVQRHREHVVRRRQADEAYQAERARQREQAEQLAEQEERRAEAVRRDYWHREPYDYGDD